MSALHRIADAAVGYRGVQARDGILSEPGLCLCVRGPGAVDGEHFAGAVDLLYWTWDALSCRIGAHGDTDGSGADSATAACVWEIPRRSVSGKPWDWWLLLRLPPSVGTAESLGRWSLVSERCRLGDAGRVRLGSVRMRRVFWTDGRPLSLRDVVFDGERRNKRPGPAPTRIVCVGNPGRIDPARQSTFIPNTRRRPPRPSVANSTDT